MNLSQLGELRLIEQIRQKSGPGHNQWMGIGDDCAVIPGTDNFDYVITTDLLIEDVHFTFDTTSHRDLGIKSLEVNVSDIAAMGATPLFALLSVAVQGDTPVPLITSFLNSFIERAQAYGISVIGGDTSRSLDRLFINVTVIGQIPKRQSLLRSGAEVGDLIVLSGDIGASATGLKWLLSGMIHQTYGADEDTSFSDAVAFCIERHRFPHARIALGQALVKSNLCTACIDMSDGLATDLKHILDESKKGAVISLDRLPVDERAKRVATTLSENPLHLAVTGGEDYELLFTFKNEGEATLRLLSESLDLPLTIIGRITDTPGELEFELEGSPYEFNLSGYDHFSATE